MEKGMGKGLVFVRALDVPLRFELFKDLALRMVADRAHLDEAAQVELLRAEH